VKRFRPFPLLALVALVTLAAPTHGGASVQTEVCGDGLWADCEFCGRDAFLATVRAEMNHDCQVNVADFGLFVRAWFLRYGGIYDPSGDFDGNAVVDLSDFLIFGGCYFNYCEVSPCHPCSEAPDSCAGTLRWSFSEDPTEDDDEITLEPGEEAEIYLVADNCPGMAALVHGWIASDNLEIGTYSGDPGGLSGAYGTGWYPPLDDSAHIVGRMSFTTYDDQPGWIRPVPFPACPGELAWGQTAPSRRMAFHRLSGVGINGPPPPDSTGCTDPTAHSQPPALSCTRSLVCRPNPGREMFWISSGRSLSQATLSVVDASGRLVRLLHRGPVTGGQEFIWDGRSDLGASVAAGVYLVCLMDQGGASSTRLVIIK
jgi:hypothetical protein